MLRYMAPRVKGCPVQELPDALLEAIFKLLPAHNNCKRGVSIQTRRARPQSTCRWPPLPAAACRCRCCCRCLPPFLPPPRHQAALHNTGYEALHGTGTLTQFSRILPLHQPHPIVSSSDVLCLACRGAVERVCRRWRGLALRCPCSASLDLSTMCAATGDSDASTAMPLSLMQYMAARSVECMDVGLMGSGDSALPPVPGLIAVAVFPELHRCAPHANH